MPVFHAAISSREEEKELLRVLIGKAKGLVSLFSIYHTPLANYTWTGQTWVYFARFISYILWLSYCPQIVAAHQGGCNQ